jgi:hypothetical protein
MIVEAPSGACNTGATPLWRKEMANAQAAAKLCAHAVMNVLFHDFLPPSDSRSPNVVELHPLLSFRCITPSFAVGGCTLGPEPRGPSPWLTSLGQSDLMK